MVDQDIEKNKDEGKDASEARKFHCLLDSGQKKMMALVIITTVLLSSVFGASFGFISALTTQGKILPKIEKIFPNVAQNIEDGTESGGDDIASTSIAEEDAAVVSVVEKASPAVVSIIITKDIQRIENRRVVDPFNFDPFDFFGLNDNSSNKAVPDSGGETIERREVGGGTGFIVTADGLIVTNKHVVTEQGASYTVMTNDGKKYDAKVMAIDPTNDIAIVKIEATDLPVLKMGDSSSLKIGQTVIAIGNALAEFRNTVSKGIISGLSRTVTAGTDSGSSETLSEVIQTDAAINLGNSGGPLIDIKGNVIGVNVAMAEGAQSIGFALPIDIVKKDIESVQKQGRIVTPYIGVRYVAVDQTIQKENNLPYSYGALIVKGDRATDLAVVPGSPADKAGIVENMIILEVEGQKIDATHPLTNIIAKHSVGDTINLKIWDKGAEKTLPVQLEERKP